MFLVNWLGWKDDQRKINAGLLLSKDIEFTTAILLSLLIYNVMEIEHVAEWREKIESLWPQVNLDLLP